MRPILDGYGIMGIFNSRTRPRVNRSYEPAGGWRAEFGGLSFALQALFLPPDTPTQLQTVQFPYLDTWKVFNECGVGGYSPGQCTVYTAWLSYC
jgi:hypothetical protein